MGKPLNIESKIFGHFRITDFFKLVAIAFVDFIFMLLLIKSLGLLVTITLFLVVLFTTTAYYILKNSLPDGFMRHWYSYRNEPQAFFPLREKSEVVNDPETSRRAG